CRTMGQAHGNILCASRRNGVRSSIRELVISFEHFVGAGREHGRDAKEYSNWRGSVSREVSLLRPQQAGRGPIDGLLAALEDRKRLRDFCNRLLRALRIDDDDVCRKAGGETVVREIEQARRPRGNPLKTLPRLICPS